MESAQDLRKGLFGLSEDSPLIRFGKYGQMGIIAPAIKKAYFPDDLTVPKSPEEKRKKELEEEERIRAANNADYDARADRELERNKELDDYIYQRNRRDMVLPKDALLAQQGEFAKDRALAQQLEEMKFADAQNARRAQMINDSANNVLNQGAPNWREGSAAVAQMFGRSY